jgi:hypothetical protein
MEKIIRVNVSLEGSMETKDDKRDITSEVFDSLTEAVSITLADAMDSDEFEEGVLDNYGQTLPDNFKGLKDMGLKIKILD